MGVISASSFFYCRLRSCVRHLRQKRVRTFIQILFGVVFVTLFGLDWLIPIAGNIYIPPRSERPSRLPYGLSLVDTQPMVHPAALDVIFIHGLGDFPDTIWRKAKSTTDPPVHDVSWIRDFLPSDLPSARLLYYNYDSTTYNDAPLKDLGDIADNLLFSLLSTDLRATKDEARRPIVFVCHSYGGLVVKEALIRASVTPDRHMDLLNHVFGIIFLGTPHLGVEYTGLARSIALRLDPLGSNPDIFLPLSANSLVLRKQHTDFLDRFSELRMTNFYETRKTVILRTWFSSLPWRAMIVKKPSAIFEAPNTENHGLDYDHSGLNKYNSRNDLGYIKILFVLRTLAHIIVHDRQLRQQENEQRNHSNWNVPSAKDQAQQCGGAHNYLVTPKTVPSFTERPDLMYLLQNSLLKDLKSDLPRSLALWGMGGAGKTQLALRYAEEHRHKFNPIIWVDVQSPSSAIKSYSIAFDRLGLEYPSNILDTIRKGSDQVPQDFTLIQDDWVVRGVLNWLESRDDNDCEWLVLLDNADQLEWIRDLLPRGRRGTVIITSRDKLVEDFVNTAIYVGKMDMDESINLILHGISSMDGELVTSSPKDEATSDIDRELRVAQEQQALAIAEDLSHHPLLLDLANSFIREHDIIRENLSLYREKLDSSTLSLLDTTRMDPHKRYRFHMDSVFESSYLAVDEISPVSTHLLHLLSFLDHSSIEDRLFSEAASSLLQTRRLSSRWNHFLVACQVLAYTLIPRWLVMFLLWACPWKPVLSGRSRDVAAKVTRAAPFMLNCVYLIVTYIWDKARVLQGDVVLRQGRLRAHAVFTCFYLSAILTIPVISTFLFGKCLPMLKPLLISCIVAVFSSWYLAWYYYGLDVFIEDHTKSLLDRLDFTGKTTTQFDDVLAGLNQVTRESLGVSYPLRLRWLLFWHLCIYVIQFLLMFGFSSTYESAVKWALGRIGGKARRISIATLKIISHWIMVEIWVALLGFLCGMLLDETGVWTRVPWEKSADPEPEVAPYLIPLLLSTTGEKRWDAFPYMDGMSPLTRFSLVQRADNQAYTMHSFVQWWLQQRLDPEARKGWVKMSYSLVQLVYQSSGCWDDVSCQQMLIPHLLSVATSDLLNDGTQYHRLYNLLKMIYRSLIKVQRM